MPFPPSSASDESVPPLPKTRLGRWWRGLRSLWGRKPVATVSSHGVPASHEALTQSRVDGQGVRFVEPLTNIGRTSLQADYVLSNLDGTLTSTGQDKKTSGQFVNISELLKNAECDLDGDRDFEESLPGLRFVKQLGSGGMGVVYEAVDLVGRPRAVKVTRPDKMSEQLKKRFYAEAFEMAKLSHENLVPILEYHEYQGLPYLTMPKYESSVSALIESKSFTTASAFQVFRDSIRGLAHLHERGYVHRDYKPGNILVDSTGKGILSDFGLLKYAWGETPDSASETPIPEQPYLNLTQTGAIVGTIPYLSPEALSTHERPTPRWDLYAAGITFYEMLHGGKPPVSSNPSSFVGKSREEAIPPIRKLHPSVPKPFEKIIKKCCAVDSPYTDARDLLRELIRYETRWYRRALVSMSLLFLGMVVSLAMLWPASQKVNPQTIKEPYAEFYTELDEGKIVELIPKQGMPRFPFRTIIAKEVASNADNQQKAFAVQAPAGADIFVDLIPNLPPGEYELRGELRCTAISESSAGGIYFGRAEFQANEGVITTIQAMHYADSLKAPSKAQFKVITHYIDDQIPGETGLSIHRLNEPTNSETVWRPFRVQLLAQENRVEWDGKTFKAAPTRITPAGRLMINERFGSKIPEDFSYGTQGGIGLIARDCLLCCRSFTIQRLPKKE